MVGPCAKNMVTMELGAGDARGAKRRALGAADRPAIDREFEYEYSLGAGRPSA